MNFKEEASRFLKENNLLRPAWKPPPKEECGYGWGVGDWEEAMYNYEHDAKYNAKLILSLVDLLRKSQRSI